MKYINAYDILPDELIILIQQYVSGEVIYVPSKSKIKWGCKTDTQKVLIKRNTDIKYKKQMGMSIEMLKDEYHLSYDTIKRIVYSK